MLASFTKIPKSLGYLRSFCTGAPGTRTPIGFSRVTVAGEVLGEQYISPSGGKSLLLRICDTNHEPAVLRVHHRAQLNIASGQYLHVTGHLHTERFTNEVGKNRTDAVVKSTDIFSVGSAHEGLNSIELKGIVAADIIKVKEFSMIRVLTTFLPHGSTEPVPSYHTVHVRDEKLRELVDRAVKKKSIIRLTGRLVVKNEVDNEKKRRSAVHIQATNIWTHASSQQYAEKLAAV